MNIPTRRKRIRKRLQNLDEIQTRQERCFACRRPRNVCHCELIPEIKNKTHIIIAQHFGERSHPFNTARIVRQALTNSTYFSDYPENICRNSHSIPIGTGLLYPSKFATDLANVSVQERPRQLLVLDGTWNHAKQMYRSWPLLQQLPHFKLSPDAPGNYRIRLEPNEYSLSTLEAVVAALKHLEPGIMGLDDLVGVFETMVDRQLAHPLANYSGSSKTRPHKINVPSKIKDPESNLVVAYGEAEPLRRGSPKKSNRPPVFWVAKRINTGEIFQHAIQTDRPITDELLSYFQLKRSNFEKSVNTAQFRRMWNRFARPNDTLVVYNQNALKLLASTGIYHKDCINIRSIDLGPTNRNLTLEQYFCKHSIKRCEPQFPGRPGRRLANLITLIRYFQNQVNNGNDAT